jgi:hypothetical protein
VAKLNFFRWAIEKEILGYIRQHQDDIEREMNQSMKELAKLRLTPTTGSSSGSSTSISTLVSSVSTQSTRSSTRRRLIHKDSAPIKLMQKHVVSTEMSFD